MCCKIRIQMHYFKLNVFIVLYNLWITLLCISLHDFCLLLG